MDPLSTWKLLEALLPYIGTIVAAVSSFIIGRRRAKKDSDASLFGMEAKLRSELNSINESLKSDMAVLKRDLQEKEKKIEMLQEEIHELRVELLNKDQNISELKFQLIKKDMELTELKAQKE